MPAKVSTLCYVHNCSDRVTQEFIVKEMTAIVKTDNNNSTKVDTYFHQRQLHLTMLQKFGLPTLFITLSIAEIKFLTTEPPRTILPIYMIEKNDEYPYYNDTIVKYMFQPNFSEFDNITYPNYFEKYSITPLSPSSNSHPIYHDNLSNYNTKRNKEILTRHCFLKIEDRDLYFYQQLLLNIPTRNESDYKTIPDSTYKEKFLSLFPEFLINLQNQT
ncbi:17502_t:CDS:2, partial [Gigaspora rosea]